MYIELKYGKNKIPTEQDKWIDNLTVQGYIVVVRHGWEAAFTALMHYLNLKKGEPGKEHIHLASSWRVDY